MARTSETPDPRYIVAEALSDLAQVAIDEGTAHHLLWRGTPRDLPDTLVMCAIDALLDLQIRHPAWFARLAGMRFGAADYAIDGADRLDAVVRDHPLTPGGDPFPQSQGPLSGQRPIDPSRQSAANSLPQ